MTALKNSGMFLKESDGLHATILYFYLYLVARVSFNVSGTVFHGRFYKLFYFGTQNLVVLFEAY